MSFWSLESFQQITAGRFLRRPINGDTAPTLRGASTDTRTIQPGQVFFALRGERFDGHDHVKDAVGAGSPLVVVDRAEAADAVRDTGASVLWTQDVLKAMGRIAGAYRQSIETRVIGVTGSVGKTTTKRMMHAVLSPHFRGSVSPKSYNNAIGVPLTLLNVQPTDAYVVVEIGTNAPGEIAALGRIVEPDIAVITGVGLSHVEGLGDFNGIVREKASLLSHMRDGGLSIVNGDVAALRAYLKVAGSVVLFGRGEECDLRLTHTEQTADSITFEVNGRWSFEMPMLGEHNALNALAVIAVGRQMKLNEAQIAAGLAHAASPEMRLTVQRLGDGVTVINDAYNANPESMAAALTVLHDFPATHRRVAVLGDMLELGDQSESLHESVIRAAQEMAFSAVILIGPRMAAAGDAIRGDGRFAHVSVITDWRDDTPQQVAAAIDPGDTVLVKASRGMRLERIASAIEQRFGVA